jgi:acyl-ACP thioesterase
MNIYSFESAVGFPNVDPSDALTIGKTFDLFQDAAINHAEILGVGREAMEKSGTVWILSRLSVFMERRPRYGEKLIVRSWPRGANKLFAIRDYDINGNAVRGRSAWLVVDLEKHRPLRPQAAMDNLPPNEDLNALPGINADSNDPPPSLAIREFTKDASFLRKACYSDIDFNGHVNNTRYIQWIQDIVEPEILQTAQQIRLDINYISEVRCGEMIRLYVLPIDGNIMAGSADNAPSPGLQGQTPLPVKAAFAIEGRREDAEAAPVFRAELRTG